MSRMSRRRFCQSLGGSGLIAQASVTATGLDALLQTAAPSPDSSHVGNLYPFVQKQTDRSRLELSFLQTRFQDLKAWQKLARARVVERLCYAPPPVAPSPQVIRRTGHDDYIEEYLTFQT